jgi:hypothetical protein
LVSRVDTRRYVRRWEKKRRGKKKKMEKECCEDRRRRPFRIGIRSHPPVLIVSGLGSLARRETFSGSSFKDDDFQ